MLLRQMAEAAWICGDPGVQYDTTINDWHTSANTGRINASNPCSEYLHVDNYSVQPCVAEPHEVRSVTTASSTSRPSAFAARV